MRISEKYDRTIILDTGEGYLECPAVFDVEGEEYPAEPYSWGEDRGTELNCRAELVSFTWGGRKFDRNDAVAITGADHVLRQENDVTEYFATDFQCGLIAAE